MNFYIASSFKNIEQVRKIANELTLRGYIHTYDWTQSEKAASLKQLAVIGTKEKQAVMNSDLFVMILPAGKGSHVELGLALSYEKRVYIYSPTSEIYEFDKTTTFYHIESVHKFVGSFDLFIQQLIEQERKLE